MGDADCLLRAHTKPRDPADGFGGLLTADVETRPLVQAAGKRAGGTRMEKRPTHTVWLKAGVVGAAMAMAALICLSPGACRGPAGL